MQQQTVSGYYNAQCCGIAVQYQRYNYGAVHRPDPVRPAVLRFVQPGRSRQLLAVQRRAGRPAPVARHGAVRFW